MVGRDAGRYHDTVAAGLRARHVHLHESALALYGQSFDGDNVVQRQERLQRGIISSGIRIQEKQRLPANFMASKLKMGNIYALLTQGGSDLSYDTRLVHSTN